METSTIVALIPVLSLIVIVALCGGGWLSEQLPELSRIFDRKPFNCRPCLTFHMVWLPIALYAWAVHSGPVMLVGTVVAFLLFGIVKYIDNKNIDK